ncbi:MAG: EAL domain-containing protein [Pseudomonadales bacterium]
MSATQRQSAPVRLLIADRTENDAYAIDSLLRNAGIATRLRFIDDVSMAADHIDDTDLLLLGAGLPDAMRAVTALRKIKARLPIILVNDADSAAVDLNEAFAQGASDLVQREHEAHLLRACEREVETSCMGIKLLQTKRALAEAEQRCQLLLQSSKAAIAYVHEGMHIYANEAYLKLFGYDDADDLVGLPLIDLTSSEGVPTLKAELKTFRQNEAETTFEFAGQTSDGESFAAGMTLAAAQYEGEHCMQVTLRTSAPEQPEVPAATTDVAASATRALESNGTRPSIGECVLAAEGAMRNLDAPCRAMFIAEIDGIEALTKEHGLQGAEQICDRVELTLQTITAGMPCITLERSKFAIVICGKDQDQVSKEANGYRQTIEELLLEVAEKTVRPTIGLFGVVQAGKETVAEQLERAHRLQQSDDTILANQVMVHKDQGDEDVGDEAAKILGLINEAIEKQKFLLLFQPIISLRGDNDEHYEVFLRMLDRHGEHMVPRQFLRTAVENNAAGKIDRWVILQSIKMLSVHRAKGHNTRLTINITCNSVADPEFIQWLGVAIKAARLPSDAVIFQVTEEDAITYLRQTREFAEGLKKLHCRTSLSRFGLVEDPYDTLEHIPADMVKLDGSLVDDSSEAAAETLTTTIRKLQSIGKLTLVPMVENANMLSMLWQAGANYIQGHYLQEPVTEMSYDFSTEE